MSRNAFRTNHARLCEARLYVTRFGGRWAARISLGMGLAFYGKGETAKEAVTKAYAALGRSAVRALRNWR